MHFAILTQYYPPETGAQPVRIHQMAKRFVESGHKVTVITAMPNYPQGVIYNGYGGLIHRETRDGVDVIHTFVYPTVRPQFVSRMTNYFSFVFSSALIGSLLLPHPDFLFVQSPPLFVGLSGFWLQLIKRTRIILNISDLWPESGVYLSYYSRNSLTYKISSFLELAYYRRAWLITGQSEGIMRHVEARCPQARTFFLSGGVDTNLFTPDTPTHVPYSELDTSGKCIVGYIGLHGMAQGLDAIVTAASILHSNEEIQFVFVGDGTLKATLIQQASELMLKNIHFLDARPSSEIPAMVASTDILLVPLKTSIPGAVPSKLYEAMAAGKPVVLVADGEPADIVTRNQCGLVVAPGDIEGIAVSIQKLANDPDLRNKLGRNGRIAAQKYYNRDKIVGQFIQYLESNL